MKIIKVNAIPSTNTFLKEALRTKSISEATCIWAINQTQGKGQRGTSWVSESGKNLTFSVLFLIPETMGIQPFVLNMVAAMAVKNALENYNLPQLKIKWPNDILSANKKIGGMLIENVYQNGVLHASIVGIGLNVNQENFEHLPKASSLKIILGNSFLLEELLKLILVNLEDLFSNYTHCNYESVKASFEKSLFRYEKPSVFVKNGSEFVGIIKGVTDLGLLVVLEEDDVTNHYDLKQIELKY